jgi:2'-5' RNA ligase
MKPKFRTFVAIELPEKIHVDIRKLQRDFASHRLNVRWVKPVNIHLTIRFLGNVDPSDVSGVGRVLSDTAANYPIFDLVPRGVGIFPNIRRPRIVWTGIAGQIDVLRSVQKSVENALVPLGFAAEKRPYRGHLTLGRIKARMDQGRLVTALRAHQDFVSETFSVKRLVMFKSELHPNGPVYTKLYEMALGASISDSHLNIRT